MIPILYATDETSFNNNGLGRLADCLECVVTEERNGEFELEFEYPMNGILYGKIELNSIIKAKPNDFDRPQLFFVHSRTDNLTSSTFHCYHISYRLSGIIVLPTSASSCEGAMEALASNTIGTHSFTFSTDQDSSASWKLDIPQTAKATLGGVDGSILDVYGGEYEWDNFDVKLLDARGSDNGVAIRYGKNLISLEKESDIGSTYNGVFPYWYREGDGTVYPTTAQMNTDMKYPYDYIRLQDFTSDYNNKPSTSTLTSRAKSAAASLTNATTSLTISFAPLWKMKEYEMLASLEKLKLCDTVTVVHEKMNVRSKLKVITTKYNVLTEAYEEITIGTARSSLADTLSNISTKASDSATNGNVKGLVKVLLYRTGSVTVPASSYLAVSATTNISESGYYPLCITQVRTMNNRVVCSSMTISRGSSYDTPSFTLQNLTSSAISVNPQVWVLYIKNGYAVATP